MTSSFLKRQIVILFAIFELFGFLGCDDVDPAESHFYKVPEEDPRRGNDFLRVDYDNNFEKRYEILREASTPVLILKDNTAKVYPNIEDITHEDFIKGEYVLLPKDHLFLENPFKSVNELFLTRPPIWGARLERLLGAKNSELFRIGAELEPAVSPVVSESKIKALFGDYKSKTIGKGGLGEVFEVEYAGKPYALKYTNEKEIEFSDMEKLQFTNAVAKVYATFALDQGPNRGLYMIMEKGESSLRKLTEIPETLDHATLLATIDSFKKLVAAHKILKIANTDVKGENILVLKLPHTRKLVVIDISSTGITRGYRGSESELLARALLENQLGKTLRGGEVPFSDYYKHSHSLIRDIFVAAPELMEAWTQNLCKKELSANDVRCDAVNDIADLYPLISEDRLSEIGQEINERYQRKGSIRHVGTHDDMFYGLYKTGLPLPQVHDLSDHQWSQYFNRRDTIGSKFCKLLGEADNFDKTESDLFFRPLKPKYDGDCVDGWAGPRFMKHFPNSQSDEFREWITDALSPLFIYELFLQMAPSFNMKSSINTLIGKTLGVDTPVGKALTELNNL